MNHFGQDIFEKIKKIFYLFLADNTMEYMFNNNNLFASSETYYYFRLKIFFWDCKCRIYSYNIDDVTPNLSLTLAYNSY